MPVSRAALMALLIWAPVASGAYRSWPLAVALLVVAIAVAAWLAAMLVARRLEWRRTPLDLPLGLLAAVLLFQLLLGNRPLVSWALAPPPLPPDLTVAFPVPAWLVGTVTPRQTLDSALIFLGYVAVYYLVVNVVRTRSDIGRLVRLLLGVGGLMAFLGLIDHLTGDTWLLSWRDHPYAGRLSGTFVNPDHFATWLAMLIPLGLGWIAARGGDGRAISWRALLAVSQAREQLLRRYVPLLGVLVMALALIFTLSRGGVLAFGAGLLVFLVLLRATGRTRGSLVLTGALLVGVGVYGSWIGFGPLLERLSRTGGGMADRAVQYLASLPMLKDFPLLGVGLGAYRDIYARYQPLVHQPHDTFYPYAHNDLLQLAVELGLVGLGVCLFLGVRLIADLVGAHLLGRGACPVDGGAGEEARRNDRYSIGIAIGALAGAAALIVHSALDFSVRIAANGFLVAALLGLASVALHTRLASGREQLLTGVRVVELSGRRGAWTAPVAIVAVVLLAAWSMYWVRLAAVRVAEDRLAAHTQSGPRLAAAEAVLAIDAASVAGLKARARARYDAARAAWLGPILPGRDRRTDAAALLGLARDDLAAALRVSPTNPFLHEDLAWVEAVDAVVHDRRGPEGLARTVASAARAITLAPDNATMYATMARLAYSLPDLGLRAAREAVRRQPHLLASLVDTYRPLSLSEAEWLSMAPDTAIDRLELGAVLESRRLWPAALAAYRAALEVAPAPQARVYRWGLARALGRQGHDEEAIAVVRAALAEDPGNAELHRTLGLALARRGDPAALDHLRLAVAAMERHAGAVERGPFDLGEPRVAAWAQREAGDDLTRATSYRRSLARYLIDRRLWEQAIVEWQTVAREAPKDAEARYGLGIAFEGAGAGDTALEHLRAAVALQPRVPRYRARLARRLWDSEQYFQAINEWRAVKSLAPTDVESRMSLARAYEKIGERSAAYHEYRAILDVAPNHPGATQALARFR
ncbi:MAG: O-antigen ligase family protein [Candidatus Rokuibacteriota bacterium]